MMIAAWALLVAALTYCANAHSPPIAAAMEPANHDSDHDESLTALPDKRILKYLLPSNQLWGGNGVNAPIPTGQEGTKRGYNNRNFLRFGRSDAEKRAGGRNFLRFGRGESEDYEDEDETSSLPTEKRDRNFLRFGRDPGRNFLRFGRPDMEQFGLEGGPLEFAQGLKDEEPSEEENRAYKNYLRFGRGNRNFLRFGRGSNKNFLRFGRSVDPETFCDDCEEEDLNKHPSASSSALSTSHVEGNTNHMASEEHNEDVEPSAVGEKNIHRAKRSAGMYYDYAVLPSHGPASWDRDFQAAEEEAEDPDLDELQDVSKRSYNRNFIRFGRNPNRNFLRFGKRDTIDGLSSQASDSNMMMTPVQYPRIIRAPTRNFLRFG